MWSTLLISVVIACMTDLKSAAVAGSRSSSSAWISMWAGVLGEAVAVTLLAMFGVVAVRLRFCLRSSSPHTPEVSLRPGRNRLVVWVGSAPNKSWIYSQSSGSSDTTRLLQ